jgi:hypothetical protein
MIQVQADLGGRPFANDDLLKLQQELTDAVQAQFLGKGPFILAGCLVSGSAAAANVTAGIICLDGQLLRFAGASGVALPAQFQAGAVVLTEPRPYQTGGTKYCMREVPAVLVATNPSYTAGQFLPVDVWGAKTWDHVQRAIIRSTKEVQMVATAALGDFDQDGLGKAGTEAWGWGLCDGNGNRIMMLGRAPLALSPSRTEFDTVGKQGGAEKVALTAAENAPHSHDFSTAANSVTFDRGSSNANAFNFDQRKNDPTTTSGSGSPHENMMPYTVLFFRVWVGYPY